MMRPWLDIHMETVNPKQIELEAAKEILAELYDIQIWTIEDLIRQRIVDFRLTGIEFELYTTARRP